MLSTAQEERWQPTLYISQSFCCPGIITNTGRTLRFSRFRTKLSNNSASEYFLYAMPNLKWNSMEYSNVLRKRQITQHKISSQKELAPERIKIRKLSVHVHKKSLGYQVNSLQGKRKGPHETRSRKHNLLPRVQCCFSSFPLITVILVNFFFCTRHNISNSKRIQGCRNGAYTIHPVFIPPTPSLAQPQHCCHSGSNNSLEKAGEEWSMIAAHIQPPPTRCQ